MTDRVHGYKVFQEPSSSMSLLGYAGHASSSLSSQHTSRRQSWSLLSLSNLWIGQGRAWLLHPKSVHVLFRFRSPNPQFRTDRYSMTVQSSSSFTSSFGVVVFAPQSFNLTFVPSFVVAPLRLHHGSFHRLCARILAFLGPGTERSFIVAFAATSDSFSCQVALSQW